MNIVDDFTGRKDGCSAKARLNRCWALLLYLVAFAASAAATVMAATGSAPGSVVAVLAAIPGLMSLALATFKPDALSQWWEAKRARLDDLLLRMRDENLSAQQASTEFREFMDKHEKNYPIFGPLPARN